MKWIYRILFIGIIPYFSGWGWIGMLSFMGNLDVPTIPLFSIFGTFLIWSAGLMFSMACLVLTGKRAFDKIESIIKMII